MCGIFGFIVPAGTPWDARILRSFIVDMIHRSEPRGREAAGLAVVIDGEAQVFKKAMRPDRLLRRPAFRKFLADNLGRAGTDGNGALAQPVAIMGHCRLVTNGAEIVTGNNQPILAEHTLGIHNGIVTNEDALWRANGDLTRTLETDSEIIFRLVDKHAAATGDLRTAVARTFGEIEGTASVVLFRDDTPALVLATNNGSLYHARAGSSGALFFASERHILKASLDANASVVGEGLAVEHLAPGEALLAPFEAPAPQPFPLAATEGVNAAPAVPAPRGPRTVIRDATERIGDLKRCTRCILPATYPFIEFDAHGVCNYCRDHQAPELYGRDALEAELARYRRTDGQPDCLVALSGGRDSSYGLHLLKTEYGMNPVAYSYDWGMVTGIARRNQARMCGKLGVEHILRAADIPAKRRYIRKNIHAWLKKPHLGMVPLFMAGDKFFYRVGRELRDETGIPLVIFCAGNPLERTDFKGGFAGIRESQHGQRLFAFSAMNKVQIAAFYAWQYLRNPAYLNESLYDSIDSFFTTFVGKDDFLYLYHFVEWDEEVINRTLIGEYGWETAPHTDNTWRIGDGYTAFINYIYRTVAGFSEFDTFRSQQVRAGILSRDEALALSERDNEPHLPTLYEFAQQIGINLEEVLTRIDAIPKLY